MDVVSGVSDCTWCHLILRGGILMSAEFYRGSPRSLTRGLLVGKLLVGCQKGGM